jgi:uncharacterized protein YggE
MQTITFKLDFRFVSGFLLLVIVAMLLIWQPWTGLSSRTVVVSGQATVKAIPDEFTFYPTYQATAATETAAISAVSKKGNQVVDKLVSLGVDEKKISTSVNADRYYPVKDGSDDTEPTATYSITAVVGSKELAQKILDYLVTTNPIYGVSPQSNFANQTRKDLEDSARKLALADAKERAEQTADELGIKLGNVVEISEPNWGGIIPLGVEGRATTDSSAPELQTSPKLLTGEQEVTYQISVTYRIR